MLCRDNRSCVHPTTLGSDAVGQAQNQQRSTRAHRRSRTRATVICTGIWITCRQITSACRRWRLENSNSTVQLWPMYKEINGLHMQPSHNSRPYTHSARVGDTGHTEHRYPRDRKKHRGMRASTTFNQHARRSERPHDNILVFGNDFESALHSLELGLIWVAEYGLQLKSTKCNLFRTSVPFLGHIVGRAGLECDPNKLSAVANWIPPSTIKGVREFLGFTGYYRRFVPDYSTVSQPLVRLLGKDCKFKWTDACQDVFKALRALLIKAPVIAFPKEDLPYIVDTNASDYGIGGVLSQRIEGT